MRGGDEKGKIAESCVYLIVDYETCSGYMYAVL